MDTAEILLYITALFAIFCLICWILAHIGRKYDIDHNRGCEIVYKH